MSRLPAIPLPGVDVLNKLFEYQPDTGYLIWRSGTGRSKAGAVAGTMSYRKGKPRALSVCVSKRLYQAHRIIWKMQTGKDPVDVVDHVNGNPFDNKWINLREATKSENQWNRKKTDRNSSGYKGVYFDTRTQKWTAQITKGGKNHYLGRFEKPESAYEAYCVASKSMHGQYSNTGESA
jgi:hypothetical protein